MDTYTEPTQDEQKRAAYALIAAGIADHVICYTCEITPSQLAAFKAHTTMGRTPFTTYVNA